MAPGQPLKCVFLYVNIFLVLCLTNLISDDMDCENEIVMAWLLALHPGSGWAVE